MDTASIIANTINEYLETKPKVIENKYIKVTVYFPNVMADEEYDDPSTEYYYFTIEYNTNLTYTLKFDGDEEIVGANELSDVFTWLKRRFDIAISTSDHFLNFVKIEAVNKTQKMNAYLENFEDENVYFKKAEKIIEILDEFVKE
jgi:hypothetical protein